MAQGKGRETQHRERRPDRKAHEISQLKRDNSRLRKDLKRLKDIQETPCVETPDTLAKTNPPESKRCGECGSTDLRTVDLGRVKLMVCGTCKWRHKIS